MSPLFLHSTLVVSTLELSALTLADLVCDRSRTRSFRRLFGLALWGARVARRFYIFLSEGQFPKEPAPLAAVPTAVGRASVPLFPPVGHCVVS